MKLYLLGVATPIALLVALYVALAAWSWVSWWFLNGRTTDFIGGWGYQHEMEESDPDYYDGRWVRVSHTHWWPPDTPRWLGRWLEPVRVWWCLRNPQHRALPPDTNGTPR